MLVTLEDIHDPLMELIKEDPVRPHIPPHQRVGNNASVWVLLNEQDEPQSVVCVAFTDTVPTQEQQLFSYQGTDATVAVLYTIWAIEKGGGQAMIVHARNHVKTNLGHIQRFVTLSPLTDMATKFHIKNGAQLLQINSHTQNFEYTL
jgi:hypothetical protein